jgi:histidinol-phosphate aminotransferase|uniref:pyridoxal phosphate-dependent aminotransferase n=1 Tax=Cephaloticoccus sp. TaxID=1985742 RepID=UPI00404B4B6D
MKTPPVMNRRLWLKSTGAAVAGITLASRFVSAGTTTNPASSIPIGPVRLSLNENPFGPAPSAIAAMQANAARSCRYPITEGTQLVATIAEKEGVSPDQILLGSGSGEILEAFAAHFGGPGGEVISANPSYGQLVNAMVRKGARAIGIPLNDAMEHDLTAMAAAVTATTQCVYICNPNNPTGTIVDSTALREFIIAVAQQVPVFVDEAYLECCDDFAANTMVGLVHEGYNVTVSRTFSKIHGLAGQRIGYGVMSAELAKSLQAGMTGGANLLGLVAAQTSLDDENYIESTRLKIKAGRDALIEVLKELGCDYAEPQGNFAFFHSGVPIAEFRPAMQAEGVIVGRPFPPYLDWCRITIGTPKEMTVAHAALRKVLG